MSSSCGVSRRRPSRETFSTSSRLRIIRRARFGLASRRPLSCRERSPGLRRLAGRRRLALPRCGLSGWRLRDGRHRQLEGSLLLGPADRAAANALGTHAQRLVRAVGERGPHGLQVGLELPPRDAGDLGADAAQVLGLAACSTLLPRLAFLPQISHTQAIAVTLDFKPVSVTCPQPGPRTESPSIPGRGEVATEVVSPNSNRSFRESGAEG